MPQIRMVAFDADDTLWRSEDYFDAAQAEFERIVAPYVTGPGALDRLAAIERANLVVFGYGVKGMALSMIEAAIEVTEQRIGAADLHRIIVLSKEMLAHPVEILPGIRAAVEEIAADHPIVMITKGDLFHQEAKVRDSGLGDLFRRIEIVSEKDTATYARLLSEFDAGASEFVMIGNSLRSDIAPVLALGGWGVHVPYHLTWALELEAEIPASDARRLYTVAEAAELPTAVRAIVDAASPESVGA